MLQGAWRRSGPRGDAKHRTDVARFGGDCDDPHGALAGTRHDVMAKTRRSTIDDDGMGVDATDFGERARTGPPSRHRRAPLGPMGRVLPLAIHAGDELPPRADSLR